MSCHNKHDTYKKIKLNRAKNYGQMGVWKVRGDGRALCVVYLRLAIKTLFSFV